MERIVVVNKRDCIFAVLRRVQQCTLVTLEILQLIFADGLVVNRELAREVKRIGIVTCICEEAVLSPADEELSSPQPAKAAPQMITASVKASNFFI